ncbi:MAG: hypothetical protein JWO38_988 [Gemmataceae bacterium]|nr:hypothetical protein [Gemmataceae bacterium]
MDERPARPNTTAPQPPGRLTTRTLALCGLTAVGELALVLSMADAGLLAGLGALVFIFLAGPPAFLALVAWRRRTHPARSRLLFRLAAWVCGCGLVALGVQCARFHTDPQVRAGRNLGPLVVPLAQWLAVLVVWLAIARAEAREKRAGSPPDSGAVV